MQANNLDQVIAELHRITDLAEHNASRLGYFSALYTRVTMAVTKGIRGGFFDDGPQMERLDVAFANLYLDAIDRRVRGEQGVRAAWSLAFDATERPEVSVLQHIYLGMNAHLLFDLPIAVATSCPPQKLSALRADFMRLNEIVDGEMGAFHEDLAQISRSLRALHRKAGKLWLLSSSATMRASRRFVWKRAAQLTGCAAHERTAMIDGFERFSQWVGAELAEPRAGIRSLFQAVRAGEDEDVRGVIRMLRPRQP